MIRRLVLHGGDTMLGRAVQLTLPYQAENEGNITDSTTAGDYLLMAMHRKHHGLLLPMDHSELDEIRQHNADGSYLWGDYVTDVVIHPPPDLRVINLETAVTETITNPDIPRKGINYHLHSKNLPLVLKRFAETTFDAAPSRGHHKRPIPYVVSFANNHVMDFGRMAFDQESLAAFANLPGDGHLVGAGIDASQAQRAVRIRSSRDDGRRQRSIAVIAVATECSGTPHTWAAGPTRSGVVWLPAIISSQAVERAMETLACVIRANGYDPGHRPYPDLLVLSIHWGPNWAYRTSPRDGGLDFQRFRQQLAHRIIKELGVDLIYGHSSHHIRGLEVYDGKLIIYGAGDLINDYEGFENPGDDAYNMLGALFVVDLHAHDGTLASLRLIPMMVDRLQLRRVANETIQRWSPTRERMEEHHHAVTSLCDAINKFSRWDAGDHAQTTLELRVVAHGDDQVPGGPILMYP